MSCAFGLCMSNLTLIIRMVAGDKPAKVSPVKMKLQLNLGA